MVFVSCLEHYIIVEKLERKVTAEIRLIISLLRLLAKISVEIRLIGLFLDAIVLSATWNNVRKKLFRGSLKCWFYINKAVWR